MCHETVVMVVKSYAPVVKSRDEQTYDLTSNFQDFTTAHQTHHKLDKHMHPEDVRIGFEMHSKLFINR